MKQIMKSVDRSFLDWCKLLKYFYEKLYIFYHNFGKNKIKVLYDSSYSAISYNTKLKLYFFYAFSEYFEFS